MKAGIIVQARMMSSRLPGKVLLPIAGKPLLAHHVNRLRPTKLPIIIATSTHRQDEKIAELAKNLECAVYRGSESDVLDRYYHAALEHDLDVVIRTTADCPLIDGQLIQKSLEAYLNAEDTRLFLSPCIQRTFPRGLDFEIFSTELLREAFVAARRTIDREHVTPHFYHPRNARVHLAHVLSDLPLSDWRVCVDTPEDFALVKEFIEQHNAHSLFGSALLSLFQSFPHLQRLNAHISQSAL